VLLVGAIAVAAIGGVWPGIAGAVVGFLLGDWLFIPPIHTFTINRAADAIAGVTFLSVAVVVSSLVDQLARRRLETARARSESEALARLAGGALASGPEALPSLLAELRATFGLDAVAILAPAEGEAAAGVRSRPASGSGSNSGSTPRWAVQASAGSPVPARPDDAQFTAAVGGGAMLVLAGSELAADDRRLLSAFVAQLRLAREQGRLLAQAASAEQLSATNELRTALLAAVSHDLRTPLASIKAAATSLLSDEVTWAPETVTSFCETINDEADRLNTLVGNLLDMSRLQSGVLHLDVRPVGLDEVVYAALASLSSSRDAGKVVVDVPETLPRVIADAALLERAIANLIDNALTWSPPDQTLRVEAGRCGDRIDFRIVDRGPGIPIDQRDAVFRPFQRLGDSGGASPNGVGLGLAVAKGFIEAMGGELTLEDTPGGGLTGVIGLPAAEPEGVAGGALETDVGYDAGAVARGVPDARSGLDTGVALDAGASSGAAQMVLP
jgi:two-component system sensor histidine kinase KdpD